MLNGREATLRAVKNFPRWMDIRKRLNTSMGGKYLQSLIEEQDEIKAAFEEFKSGFFLKTYLCHEDDVLCQVYVTQIGTLKEVISKDSRYEITENPYIFTGNTKKYALYQNGYILLDPDNVNSDRMFYYISGGQTYSSKLEKKDLWNIFDEFALFSSLERYEGESNSQLVQRILYSFKRPTNGTEQGIKNAIINSIMNYDSLDLDDIIIERPNGQNMYTLIENEKTVYDTMSEINKDVAREKIWNHTNWENGFKKMAYIPNVWDAPLEGYQDGVGQRNDLLARLSTEYSDRETTDIEVMGYKTSSITINEYIRKQGIKKNIPLKLTRYKNELTAKNVSYKIVANSVTEINPGKIFIQGLERRSGNFSINLDEIIIDKGTVTEISSGKIDPNKLYTLKFRARDPYQDMRIEQFSFFSNDGQETDLLTPKGTFKLIDGILKNTDVKLHVDSYSKILSPLSMRDDPEGGITLNATGTRGSFSLDVSNMGGWPLRVKTRCKKTDYTGNSSYVKFNGGFHLSKDSSEIICTTADSSSQVIIEMDCAQLSYDLASANTPSLQGSISVTVEIDGQISPTHSGLKTEGRTYSIDLDNLHHVKVTITKAGLNPVIIRNICAASYRIKYSLSKKDIIYNSDGTMKLPTEIGNGTYLSVVIDSFSTFAPVIEYIHVGKTVEDAVYEVTNFNGGNNGGSFKIDTNCRVELYENGNQINTDFRTNSIYKNNTNDIATIFIDTEEFLSIQSSSVKIYRGSYKGKIVGYIHLAPGEQISVIKINGEKKIMRLRRSIFSLLNLSQSDKVYISKDISGFIILDKNGVTSLSSISRNVFDQRTTEFKVENLPVDTLSIFAANNFLNESIWFNGDFDHFYIEQANTETYTAYNEVKMFLSRLDNIEMVNTFYPFLDMNRLMFYRIEKIADDKVTVNFEHLDGHYRNWSLGKNHRGIQVKYDLDYSNMDIYQIVIDNLNESFTVSNTMNLKEIYAQNGQTYEIARYIIQPPDDMMITYSIEIVQENIIPERDGFNKLYYSNVRKILSVEIDGQKIPEQDYSLVEKAGIIIWKKDYSGRKASIMYEYRKPKSLEFKDLSSLYEIVGYSIDAYAPINTKPIIIKELKDGETRSIVIEGIVPDKITVRCNNDNFYGVITGNEVRIQRHIDAAVAIIHDGYYYDGEKEFFMYQKAEKEENDTSKNIEYRRVQRFGDTIRTRQNARNYVYDTKIINGDHFEPTCQIDCVSDAERIQTASKLKYITACNSYQMWNDFNMEISIGRGLNGNGLYFKPDNKYSYAYIDITSYVEENTALNLVADLTIKAFIMEEILAYDDSMSRSNFAGIKTECQRKDRQVFHTFKNLSENRRYFLLIAGYGMIDDIIIRDFHSKNIHRKNIDLLNLHIEEFALKNYEARLKFDPENTFFEGLEISRDDTIETGAPIDWGVTLIGKLQENFNAFISDGVDLRKNAFYSGRNKGEITSPWIEINSYKSIESLFVKINDMMIDSFQFFDVHLYTAEDKTGHNACEIAFERKSNLIAFKPTYLLRYIRLVIEMPPERVINSIEVYGGYSEKTNGQVLHIPPESSGTLTTKIYNTVTKGNYRLKYIDGIIQHPEDVKIWIRGYKQDKEHGVWTKWYNYDEGHIFEDYQFFQFKIALTNIDANIKIKDFVLEAV